MIYKQLSYLPIIFQVDEGIILNVNEYLIRNKLLFSNVLVVSGKAHSYKHAEELANINNWTNYILEDNSIDDVNALKAYLLENNVDLIVAIGGGRLLILLKELVTLLT